MRKQTFGIINYLLTHIKEKQEMELKLKYAVSKSNIVPYHVIYYMPTFVSRYMHTYTNFRNFFFNWTKFSPLTNNLRS